MSRPTSRALQILELLQSSGIRSASELSTHLGVDERTVRRDVEHLRELDVPVEAVRGRYGGYRMGSGYRMPPLVLTDDEAVALLLGLLRAEADPRAGVTGSAAATARAKIRRALPEATGRRFDALASAVTVAGAEPAARSSDVDSSLLLTVADAVQARRVLSLRYRSASDELSRREVHPYDLVAYAGRWYLLALDVGRREERTFRVDRMMSARTLPGSFPGPPARDAEAHLVAALQGAERPWHVVLRIQATEERIRAQLPPSVARLRADADDSPAAWRVAEIYAERLDWLTGVILALRCPVVIEQPAELRDLVRDEAARLLRTALGE